jgi:uncharacterized protein (TIGR01244 family)
MTIPAVSQEPTFSGQLAPEHFALLASRGVRLVINNRPDGEAPGQLTAAAGAKLAAEAGMAYRHIPVRFQTLSAEEIDAFGDALATANGPVHAHCAGGPRSVTLWLLSRVRRAEITPEEASDWAAAHGVNFAVGLGWLDRNPT